MTKGRISRVAIVGGALAAALLTTAMPAHAQINRELSMGNSCAHPLRVVIAYADADGTWHTNGWYEYAANEEATPLAYDENDDHLIILPDSNEFYIYAETTDGTDYYWEGEDYRATFDGLGYHMMRAQIDVISGKLTVDLSCDNIDDG